MEYFVADSYSNDKKLGQPFEVNGKMYYNIRRTCGKCGGHGLISAYGHIDGGVCWDCSGAGFEELTVRAYTQNEIDSMHRAAERRAAAAEKAKLDKAEENRINWLERNGFNDTSTFIYFGNTYAIKDMLKENGAKYNNELGWHSAEAINVPAEIGVEEVKFDDLYTVNDYGYCNPKGNIKEFVKALADKYTAEEPVESGEYVGEIGERLRNLNTKITSVFEKESAYGLMQIITFKDEEDHTYVWMTSSLQDVESGQSCVLSGTVKDHKEFRGIFQTVLSRCKLG